MPPTTESALNIPHNDFTSDAVTFFPHLLILPSGFCLAFFFIFIFIRSMIQFSPDKVQMHPRSEIVEPFHKITFWIKFLNSVFCYSLGFRLGLTGRALTLERIWSCQLLKAEEAGPVCRLW